jgi:isopentenyl-diphosphate delta-isomerase
MEMVILVDENDKPIGTMEKMEAHRKGRLHRAFSVVIYNANGEMLLQKRAGNKYHSPGLWTNTCCSHPQPGEKTEDAAQRRLNEEMGINLRPEFSHIFLYRTPLEPDLIEHELDHVFIGRFNGEPVINQDEVADWKYADLEWLRADVLKNPEHYTYWFRLMLTHPQLMP